MARRPAHQPPEKSSKPPVKPRLTRSKKSAAPVEPDAEEDSSPELDDPEASAKCKIDWSDEKINFTLLNAITNDDDIKQGLYPVPGGAMTSLKQGGMKKTKWQWKLAIAIFENHAIYGRSFRETLNCSETKVASKLQAIWAAKIKNRLKRMSDITREHIQTLGQTGEGIMRTEDVDMSLNNHFTNKWAEITADCPWFLSMRSLIAARPNLIPTGIGNSSTDIDLTISNNESSEADVGPSDFDCEQDTATSDSSYPGHGFLDDDVANELEMSDIEDELLAEPVVEQPQVPDKTKKRKHLVGESEDNNIDINPDVKPAVKKGPRPGTSKPAAPPAATKKKSRLEEFGAVAQAEEVTRQKEIELNQAKVNALKYVKSERAQMQRDIIQAKLAKENMKLQIKKDVAIEGMRLKHQFKLEQLRLKAGRETRAPSTSTFNPFSQAGPSTLASVTAQAPSDGEFDPFSFMQNDQSDFGTVDNTFL